MLRLTRHDDPPPLDRLRPRSERVGHHRARWIVGADRRFDVLDQDHQVERVGR